MAARYVARRRQRISADRASPAGSGRRYRLDTRRREQLRSWRFPNAGGENIRQAANQLTASPLVIGSFRTGLPTVTCPERSVSRESEAAAKRTDTAEASLTRCWRHRNMGVPMPEVRNTKSRAKDFYAGGPRGRSRRAQRARKPIIANVTGRLPSLHGICSTTTPCSGHCSRRGAYRKYVSIPHSGTNNQRRAASRSATWRSSERSPAGRATRPPRARMPYARW